MTNSHCPDTAFLATQGCLVCKCSFRITSVLSLRGAKRWYCVCFEIEADGHADRSPGRYRNDFSEVTALVLWFPFKQFVGLLTSVL